MQKIGMQMSFKKITTSRPANKLRRNICRKLHVTKKYALKNDQKLDTALGTILNTQCGPRSQRV